MDKRQNGKNSNGAEPYLVSYNYNETIKRHSPHNSCHRRYLVMMIVTKAVISVTAILPVLTYLILSLVMWTISICYLLPTRLLQEWYVYIINA